MTNYNNIVKKKKITQDILREKFQNHGIPSDEKIVLAMLEMFSEIFQLLRQTTILALAPII